MKHTCHEEAKHDAHTCCGCPSSPLDLSRRTFMGGSVAGAVALAATGMTQAQTPAPEKPPLGPLGELPAPPGRRPLVVKPVLTYSVPKRAPQTSWRSWGGIETEEQAREEQKRIEAELNGLKEKADYPVTFLPTSLLHNAAELSKLPDAAQTDAYIIYAAGGSIESVHELGKPVIVFLRHQSGPVSLWYEIVSPRYLRQHTDDQKLAAILPEDIVVDRVDELNWRLRSLCGLVNALNMKIVTIGGAAAWAQPANVVPDLVKKLWKIEYHDVPYEELAKHIKAAKADAPAVALAKARAEAYLKTGGTKLETEAKYVENAMLLEHVFRRLMVRSGTRAITVNHCMGTIMPMSETTACMALSTLNDDGYLAFCESDFVVIPSGLLLAAIAGKPVFLNDPTYPHDGVVTLAHCTAPRKMDGKNMEPARLLTHFESDYGAAPKVDMKVGETVTNIIPDFASKRWVGFVGTIAENPFLPICRSQIEVKFTCDSETMAQRMPGFHWMTCYGDYTKELSYALRRVPITWELLS